MRLRVLMTDGTDVFKNLAQEHAIIKISADENLDPCLRIWRNDKSIIMGRGQNIINELNQAFCDENEIKIARRISGGGTVYHDLGNWNLSLFLSPKLRIKMGFSDLPSITKGISHFYIKIIREMGFTDLSVEHDSNLLWDGKKFSGSAGYKYKGWNMHHSTFLIKTDLKFLNNAVLTRNRNPSDPKHSRYFDTTNLFDLKIGDLVTQIKGRFEEEFGIKNYHGQFHPTEIRIAEDLYRNLYTTKEWIFEGKRK